MPVTLTASADNILAGRPHVTPDLEQEIAFPLRHPRFVLRDLESDKRNFNYLMKNKVSAKLKSIFSFSL